MIVAGQQSSHEMAGGLIAAGGVVGFRTDTFYGLGADPFNREALRKINALKGREGGKPILLVISDAAEAECFIAAQSKLFEAVAERHWPGALTLVAAARPEIPEELTAGSGSIGVRLPDDERVRDFVRAVGGALTATSANLAGQPPASTALEVAEYFPAELDLIIDDGLATGGKPSTVLDVSGPAARLIREGAVSRDELLRTLQAIGAELLA